MASGRGSLQGHSRPSLFLSLPLLFWVFASTASAASAVLGIDLGTNFIKAAIVKPGTPLDIVLTKDSKRKEAAVVAFKPSSNGPVELGSFPERLYGGDALALAGRFPGDVYTNLKPLLGVDPSSASVVDEYKSRFPAIKVETSKGKGSVAVKSGAFSDKEQPWTVEELLAMELKNIRGNAEAMAGKGSKITEAVITVPAFYTADERAAVERAAAMAGLNVMGLISDGLAVGVDYSVKREFPNVSRGQKPELHLVFDMGASSTTATVLKFQSRDVKDVGKFNKTVQEVSVAGTGWDRTLGGNALNGVVMDHLVSEFMKKSEVSSAGISEADITKHGRTASKLWREAERARQVLSANSDVRSSFEGLYNDIDFATKLSRTQFEELAASFTEKVEGPVKQALEMAKIGMSDLTSVILHGGAIRTPFVQKKLEALVGKSADIRSNVNADESAAFGAAFKAAAMSPSFRVKEIRDAESAVYAAGIKHKQGDKDRQQQIFIPTSLSGIPKQVQFKDKTDFEFVIYQKINDEMVPIQKIETKNVTAGVKALQDDFGCTADEVATKFLMQLNPVNGVPEVVNGIVQCMVEGDGKKPGIVDSVKGLFGGKKEQAPLKDSSSSGASGSSSSSSSSAAASASGDPNKTETAKKDEGMTLRFESRLIDFTTTKQGLPEPSKEQRGRMVERLAAFDRSDKARIVREEAFNTLESFTYRARDLLTDAGFESFSTEDVRSKLSSLLSSTSDWLYGEGANAPSDVLKKKLAEFKVLTDPVQQRQKDSVSRPEKVKLLQTALDQTKSLMDNVAKEVAKAAESASSAATEAASSVSSAVSPSSSSTKDELDELEEPETSSTSSSAKASSTPSFSPYTKEDLTEITEAYESVKSWLAEKTAAQQKLPSYEDAVLSIKDIEAKAESLNRATMSLIQKKLRMPKKPSSSKSKKSKAKKTKSSSSSSTTSGASSATSSTSLAASSASESPAAKPFNIPEGKTPTEEEILEMIKNAAEMPGVLKAEKEATYDDEDKQIHDEL